MRNKPNKFDIRALCYILSFMIFGIIVALAEKYDSREEICQKCNCSSYEQADENEAQIFTIDCSMKGLDYLVTEWPDNINNSRKEIVYISSFNTIKKLPLFPTTEAVLLFTCKKCQISEIQENAFIDAKNIMLLDLSHNDISSDTLNPNVFRGPHSDDMYSPISLQMLDLSHNSITFLDEKLFEHTPFLRKLVLSYNNLQTIHKGTLNALASCEHLEILHLEHVGISDLPNELFENMNRLSEIILNDNQFVEVPSSLTLIGGSLEMLQLSNNPIETINHLSFKNLKKLEKLYLSSMSELKTIENSSFIELTSLEVLNCMSNAKLIEMSLEDLLYLKQLKELDLSNNNLKSLNFGVTEVEMSENTTEKKVFFWNLHTLKLAGNPWKCDCNIMRGLEFFNHNSSYFKKAKQSDEARCASPFDLMSKLLYILPFDYVCAANDKSKPLKIPVYEPPQFLRPKSIMLTIGSVVLVVVLGTVIGVLIVCIIRRLKSNRVDNSNPIRYSVVRSSTIVSNVVNVNYQQP